MDLSEDKVRSIVERVVSRLQTQPGSPALPAPVLSSGDLGIFEDVEEAVQASEQAFARFGDYSLDFRKQMIQAIRAACHQHVDIVSRMAVEETGLGRAEDKIAKNVLAIDKTPGPEILEAKAISGDLGLTINERAPFGVIGSVTPCTNPTETIINNTISILSGGNTVVFCTHPSAKRVSNYMVNVINQAIMQAGGPPNLVVALREPSIDRAQKVMQHSKIRLLVVTGGPAVVQQAMRSGKKVVGAGPGNPPVVVDETADLAKAGCDIVRGASLDNNIICLDEKELIVVESVADRLKQEMLNNGAIEVKGWHLKQLEKLLLKENKGPRRHSVSHKEWIGKDAHKILEAIGIQADPSNRLIVCETDENHPFVWTELLTPVLPMVRVSNVDYAIQLAKEAEHGFGHTAVMHSHNLDKLSKMARVINTSIFVKNGLAVAGIGFGGEGHTSYTIASPTGDGVTDARTFTRDRRCTIVEHFRIV
ncbi:MAG: aldehyde dehydrogenase EutE [Candidatus Sericytochromatia bacterium]|nr:aldehyde dehydrogenase EutE [Candidatus Sericytochromatia bacterium]